MPEIPLGFGQIRHVFQGTSVGRLAMVTYGIANTGPTTAALCAQAAHNAMEDVVNQTVHQTAGLIRTECQLGPSPTGPTGEFVFDEPGGVGGDAMTPQVAILVKKLSASGGRPNRGRFYIPFTGESIISGAGVIASANVTLIQAELDGFLAELDAQNIPMVILHNDGSTPTDVTSLVVDSKVATQRRRLVR